MAKEPRSVHGKVAAITGGARGIGAATARAFVREGMKVAIGDLDREAAERTAATLGGATVGLELNVTDKGSFERFLDEVESRLGPVDVLVNNAGIMQLGRFVDEDDATAARMIDINLHGVVWGMKLVLPRMQARNSGHVVNIASQAGKAGFPGGATYCATKHAVIGLSEAVRAELRDTNIEVSYVMPGVVNTELGSGLMDARGVKKLEPEEVADAILDALRYGTVDVWVPRSTKLINRGMTLVPRRVAESFARLLRADKILAEPNVAVRRSYEERAARSEPGREPEVAAGSQRPGPAEAPAPAEPQREPERV